MLLTHPRLSVRAGSASESDQERRSQGGDVGGKGRMERVVEGEIKHEVRILGCLASSFCLAS